MIETRKTATAPAQTPTGLGGPVRLTGYASVTGVPYDVTDFLGTYAETIARGAFTRAINEGQDVRLLVNHDGIPLARTSSGTLTLREVLRPQDDPQGLGQTGLWIDASIDTAGSPLAQSAQSALARRDMSQMSFAFACSATGQTWDKAYMNRTVTDLDLHDVSVVTYPASPTTSAAMDQAA
jgi:HK97 family phage prohead protease